MEFIKIPVNGIMKALSKAYEYTGLGKLFVCYWIPDVYKYNDQLGPCLFKTIWKMTNPLETMIPSADMNTHYISWTAMQ